MGEKLLSEVLLENYSQYSNSTKYEVLVANNTGKTQITDCKKIGLLSLEEEGCSLFLPKKSCTTGHSLTLFIYPQNLKKNFKNLFNLTDNQLEGVLAITAKVIEIGDYDDESICINVNFMQYVKEDWANFINFFKERQSKVSHTISKMKI